MDPASDRAAGRTADDDHFDYDHHAFDAGAGGFAADGRMRATTLTPRDRHPRRWLQGRFRQFLRQREARLRDTKAPYVAAIPTKGIHAPITITATIHLSGKTQTLLRRRASSC